MATKMTASEITERINKTEEAIKKLENLIQKRINERLPKLEKEWEAETDENKKFWKSCDIKHTKEDIENGKKKLEEKKATLKKKASKVGRNKRNRQSNQENPGTVKETDGTD